MKLVYAVISVAVLVATSTSVAQTPEGTCAKLLPGDKLQAAVGKGLNAVSAVVEPRGSLTCAWMRRSPDPFATVAIEYYEKKIIPATSPEGNRKPEALYEDMVTPHETMSKAKREPIPGVGKKAVYVAASPQGLVVIERDDGVMRIVMNGLSKAQAIAVAKAVSIP
jgi:hypothetical protein